MHLPVSPPKPWGGRSTACRALTLQKEGELPEHSLGLAAHLVPFLESNLTAWVEADLTGKKETAAVLGRGALAINGAVVIELC